MEGEKAGAAARLWSVIFFRRTTGSFFLGVFLKHRGAMFGCFCFGKIPLVQCGEWTAGTKSFPEEAVVGGHVGRQRWDRFW